MPTTPAPWLIPYPSGTDRVMDGDNAMQASAERIADLFNSTLATGNTPYTALALGSGWTGSVSYAVRAGWVHLYVAATKASWVAGEYLVSVPVPAWACPKYQLYFGCVGTTAAGNVRGVFVGTTGAAQVVAASSTDGGLAGHTAWPLATGL